ncbi:MAG: NADH-quinone oxidoreductase subunit C [Magnetospirillum sp.]|nr:NADH-quinone oxidoreductase subunit C [Magnetospirillum sp.]
MSAPTTDQGTVLAEALNAVAPGRFRADRDARGVLTAWFALDDKDDLPPVAALLRSLGARLITITALSPHRAPPGGEHALAYHFDLGGDLLTVTVTVPPGGAVKSLVPLFPAADWNEREFAELYGIALEGHPNPRRLFVDESVDGAALDRLIPFSTLANAASTKTLWETLLAAKGEDTP